MKKSSKLVLLLAVCLVVALFAPQAFQTNRAEASYNYVWNKYQVASEIQWYQFKYSSQTDGGGFTTRSGWTQRNLDVLTGEVTYSGDYVTITGDNMTYNQDGSAVSQKVYEKDVNGKHWTYTNRCTSGCTTGQVPENSKNYTLRSDTVAPVYADAAGAFIGTVEGSSSSDYPTDGKAADGFWYTLVNTPPKVTADNANRLISGSGSMQMVGSVLDAEGDKVRISATIGGVTKSIDVTGTSVKKSWTLTWTGAEVPTGNYKDIPVTIMQVP